MPVFNLSMVVNGHWRLGLGDFVTAQEAVLALKHHVATYSAISRPTFAKSWNKQSLRIDYGAKDCYYLIERKDRQ